eukprot:GHRQ01009730.1.p1 GENE.GHRQ01009730.1~~GHRQ01009730.1.p1  ORF type:complete len:147 (+),score=2.53 GHRQ01009730.1:259-699(+)
MQRSVAAASTGRPFCGAKVARARSAVGRPCQAHMNRRTAICVPIIGLAASSLPCAPASAMDVAVEKDKQGRPRVRYEKPGMHPACAWPHDVHLCSWCVCVFSCRNAHIASTVQQMQHLTWLECCVDSQGSPTWAVERLCAIRCVAG